MEIELLFKYVLLLFWILVFLHKWHTWKYRRGSEFSRVWNERLFGTKYSRMDEVKFVGQPLKNLKGYGLHFTNFAWSILEYLAPFVPSSLSGFQKSWNIFLSISVFYSNRENSVILWFYVLVTVEIDLFLDVLQCAVLFAVSLLR